MSQPVERESMEVDVLYVGGGPASLASAIHLMGRGDAWNQVAAARQRPTFAPPSVLVLEKGAAIGDHMLSGAVMNPKAIAELVPDFASQGFPTEHVCDYAGFWVFHPKGKLSVPVVPPNFQKKGYHVVSLYRVAKWLAERAEALGVDIFPGFAADELLVEGDRVVGVRTGDMGVDRNGSPTAQSCSTSRTSCAPSFRTWSGAASRRSRWAGVPSGASATRWTKRWYGWRVKRSARVSS
jgi:electron-transferring-flavoprotein dehydrogenase